MAADPASLTAADLRLHEALGISPDLLRQQQVYRVTDREGRELIGLPRYHGLLDGVVYSYLGQDHRPLTYRLRRDNPEIEAGKPKNKYLSPAYDRRRLYIVSTAEALLADVGVPVLIVEAEKSVLAAISAAQRLQRPLVAVGIGGCWGWRGRIGKVDAANGARVDEVGPLPDWHTFTWANRQAILIFDSNTASNSKVQAARSALATFLRSLQAKVRLIDLPAEPGVNGVDDYLGHHDDAALFRLIDTARPIAAPPIAKSRPTLTLTSVGELLAEPDESVQFIVEGLIAAESVNVLSAKPKVGKSTLARWLALAVARGDDFLGRRCPEIGTVWYLAFEGTRGDIRRAFRKLGTTADDPIRLFIGKAPQAVIPQLRDHAVRERPALIIIDTMQRFLRAKDTSSYAEMTLLFDDVIHIAQVSKAALLLLTHSGKVDRDGLDAVLGSTAIAGSVDTVILLKRSDGYRTIQTIQRTGDDLTECLLRLDDAGRVHLAGDRALADRMQMERQFVRVLEKSPGPVRRQDLLEQVEGRRAVKVRVLQDLRNREITGTTGTTGTINVIGRGTRSDPHLYSICGSGFPLQGGNAGTRNDISQSADGVSEKKAGSHSCAGGTTLDRIDPDDDPGNPNDPDDGLI